MASRFNFLHKDLFDFFQLCLQLYLQYEWSYEATLLKKRLSTKIFYILSSHSFLPSLLHFSPPPLSIQQFEGDSGHYAGKNVLHLGCDDDDDEHFGVPMPWRCESTAVLLAVENTAQQENCKLYKILLKCA